MVATPTPLGELLFWNEPADSSASGTQVTDARDPRLAIFTDRVIYDPTGGTLFAEGWAADVSARQPLSSLACGEPALAGGCRLDYGLPRDDVAAAMHAEALVRTGWRLEASLTPEEWGTLRSRSALLLRAVLPGGRASRAEVDLSRARVLGPLDGAEWASLPAAIARAAALGRADRAGLGRRRTAAARGTQ